MTGFCPLSILLRKTLIGFRGGEAGTRERGWEAVNKRRTPVRRLFTGLRASSSSDSNVRVRRGLNLER